MVKNLAKMTDAKTVEGSSLKIDAHNPAKAAEVASPDLSKMDADTSKHVLINNASVTKADIECSNGVIHIIDTVLMP
jgi:uncharacterized surface protein with fasciclin (FAS1) repeats